MIRKQLLPILVLFLFVLLLSSGISASPMADELSEDWEGGIDPAIWRAYGSPLPRLYDGKGVGGSRAVDPNGDSSYLQRCDYLAVI